VSPGIVLLLLAAALAVTLGALVMARRRKGGWWADSGRAAGVLGAARGPFAVILAFVIFIAFQNFNDARGGADQEAAATRRLFKDADLIDVVIRRQVQANLLCYARGVISLDWPSMRQGGSSEVVDDNVALLEDQLQAVHANGAAGPFMDSILADVASRDQARADRIAQSESGIPGPVWIVLALGAFTVLGYVVLFADPAELFVSQAVMVGSVTVVVAGGLLLIWFLSHPFGDQMGSIKPAAMERTLVELQRDPAFTESGLPATCDADGRPIASAGTG
jgi:hypothetical protein